MTLDDKYADEMKRLDEYDTERRHEEADKLLKEILILHGYNKTVKAYESFMKWYA